MQYSKNVSYYIKRSVSVLFAAVLIVGVGLPCTTYLSDSGLNVSAAESTASETDLKNKSYVNSTSLKLGETVRITGKASGGSGTYRYSFYFKRITSANWNSIGTENGISRSAVFKPVSAGIFDVRIDIKDSTGTVVSKYIVVEASSGKFENISALNRNIITDLSVPIKLYGLGVGGSGDYTYAYYFKRSVNNSWKILGTEFSTQKEVRLYPTVFADYDIMIKARDEKTKEILSKTFTVTSNKTEALVNLSTISTETVKPGESVKLTGKVSGGKAPYRFTYQFKRQNNTKWNTIGQADTDFMKAVLTPASSAVYDIRVTVKDADNKESVKMFTLASYNIENNSTIDKAEVNAGNQITITADTSGGAGNSRYSYYYKKSADSQWTAIGEEQSESSSAVFIPEQAGNYDILVKVLDSSGIVTEKDFSVTVNEKLENFSSINGTVIKKGSTVELTGAASGGAGEYKYSYYYQKMGNMNWYTMGDELTTDTFKKFSPSSASVYTFKVVVTDKINDKSEKTFVVTVKSSGSDELPIIPAT